MCVTYLGNIAYIEAIVPSCVLLTNPCQPNKNAK